MKGDLHVTTHLTSLFASHLYIFIVAYSFTPFVNVVKHVSIHHTLSYKHLNKINIKLNKLIKEKIRKKLIMRKVNYHDGNMCFDVQIYEKSGYEKIDISVTEKQQEFTVSEVKKRRGRPRKNPLAPPPLKSCGDGPCTQLKYIFFIF